MKGKLFLRDVLVQIRRRTKRQKEPLPADDAEGGPVLAGVWPPGGL